MKNTLVFIGRFQPFHLGHEAVIAEAINKASEVIVVIGSSFQPRTLRNPFTFEERREQIKLAFPQTKVKVVGVMDYPYDDNAWVSSVQQVVHDNATTDNIGLIGHSKDESSYYLNIFKQWKNHVEVPNFNGLNATDLRNMIFESETPLSEMWQHIPSDSKIELKKQLKHIVFNERIGELNEFLRLYKEKWESAPFEPTFVTTDAVLTQSGYVLLIKRGGHPFKDNWALPGGYLEPNMSIVDNMIKELREETRVKVPEKVLRGSSPKQSKIFDMPDRDPRGRTITHAFHVDLGYPNESLPKVKGSDDAKEARWFPLNTITSDMMAFDHYHIIKHFIPTY
jgi:bifunctional NMN adenylyltransferase/nudix hydrolase